MAMVCRPGGAEAVDGDAPGGHRQLRENDRQAGQIAVLLADVAGGADVDVFHLVRRELRVAVEQCVDAMGEHVVGTGEVEAAAK
jgi:hypothetical protein